MFDFFLARESMTINNIQVLGTRHRDDEFLKISERFDAINRKYCTRSNSSFKFDKLILVVVDALGSNFIPSLSQTRNIDMKDYTMPFLEKSMRSGEAIGFIAEAATPTVTMPRIKSLVSGTVPSFLDILFNLSGNVSKFDDENLIDIAKERGKSIVFYGDDTWLSLFKKDTFLRYKETFSFFATDYISVDTNVTERAIPETELPTIDWDFMILHYLGLDHIGHYFGTNTNNHMKNKLLEMDEVIQKMHSNMAKKSHRTLFVVCGDHGMNDVGNHGGGSDSEAQTAMIFLSVNQKFNTIDPSRTERIHQVDLAPTLSLLLGLPEPASSKGVVIGKLLKYLMAEDDLTLACASLANFLNLFRQAGLDTSKRTSITNLLVESESPDVDFKNLTQRYLNISRGLQKDFLMNLSSHRSPVLMLAILTGVTLLSLFSIKKPLVQLQFPTMNARGQIACIATYLTPILLLGSTNFIEYEALFWPIFTAITFVCLIVITTPIMDKYYKLNTKPVDSDLRFNLVILTLSFVSSWLINNLLFSGISIMSNLILPLFSVSIICNSVRKHSEVGRSKTMIAILIAIFLILSITFDDIKSYDEFNRISQTLIQVISILAILSYNLINIYMHLTKVSNKASSLGYKLSSGFLLVAFLLSRRHNFFFLICQLIMETNVNIILSKLRAPSIVKVLIYVNFAQTAFYCQGNSNLFSTIDLKPAFYGQTRYSLSLSVPLVIISTYSSQIYWIMKLFQRIQESKKDFGNNLGGPAGKLIVLKNMHSLTYYMYVCVILRNHLFIWSVISPKLVYHFVSNLIIMLTVLIMFKLTQIEEFMTERLYKKQKSFESLI